MWQGISPKNIKVSTNLLPAVRTVLPHKTPGGGEDFADKIMKVKLMEVTMTGEEISAKLATEVMGWKHHSFLGWVCGKTVGECLTDKEWCPHLRKE